MKADDSIKAIYYLNTFPEGHYAFWDISKNIGEWRTSKPHYLKTAVDSETVCTYDLFLSLDEAIKTE